MDRPFPPSDLLDEFVLPVFLPAPELVDWMRQTFIDDDASVRNEDHTHLTQAHVGALWTNVTNARGGRQIIGQCEIPTGGIGGKWSKARQEAQLIGWFGLVPDFVLTFDATYCAQCSDAELMALVEHELYHAGQARDAFGQPKFHRDGTPVFSMRGHDIEEFTGVVRRYGADASVCIRVPLRRSQRS